MKMKTKNDQKQYRNNHKDAGFTMIELAVVMAISGMVMLLIANYVRIYTINAKQEKTIEHIELAQSALKEFVGLNGRYPCPANPGLGPGDVNYGVERCRDYNDDAHHFGDCDDLAPEGEIVCTRREARDGNDDGRDDAVVIGILPFRTLANNVDDTPFREAQKADGFGTMFSYAVTEHMTQGTLENPVNPRTGGIRIVDENNISVVAVRMINDDGDLVIVRDDTAHYVLFSHGDNALGGWSNQGERISNCFNSALDIDGDGALDEDEVVAGNRSEIVNCENNDAKFIKGIRIMADGNQYNDDTLVFGIEGIVPLWKRALVNDPGEARIYNTNVGNVGIGTDDPGFQLHIVGDVSAQGGVAADLDSGAAYCDSSVNDDDERPCLAPEFFAQIDATGTSSACNNPSQAAYAIQENTVECRNVEWVAPVSSCPGVAQGQPEQTYLNGFSNRGSIRCCNENNTNCVVIDAP